MALKVRDEGDILEANLRFHHAIGVDHFVVTDNGSTDETPEILGRYVDAGLAHVIHEPGADLIAGNTGFGLSQRMQSFVLDETSNPFNVLAPGKRPRATLSPSLALRDGKPFLSFAVQGGDAQDQNLLQFFLNFVEFGMSVQQAVEAANVNSYQMHDSFGDHTAEPGRLIVRADTPSWVRAELERMGYRIETWERTSGPINAIYVDRQHGSLWGGSSDFGEDYGIAW